MPKRRRYPGGHCCCCTCASFARGRRPATSWHTWYLSSQLQRWFANTAGVARQVNTQPRLGMMTQIMRRLELSDLKRWANQGLISYLSERVQQLGLDSALRCACSSGHGRLPGRALRTDSNVDHRLLFFRLRERRMKSSVEVQQMMRQASIRQPARVFLSKGLLFRTRRSAVDRWMREGSVAGRRITVCRTDADRIVSSFVCGKHSSVTLEVRNHAPKKYDAHSESIYPQFTASMNVPTCPST